MEIRRPVSVFLCLIAVCTFASLHAQNPIALGRPVRIGVFPAYPVSFIEDSGEVRGLAPDTLEAIFDEFQIPWEFREFPSFASAIEAIASREIDILGGAIKTPEREAIYTFNEEPFLVSWGQVYSAGEREFTSLFDLRNLRIGLMVGGQNGINFLETMNAFDIGFSPVYYQNHGEITDAILMGEVDAGIFYSVYFLGEERIKPTDVVFSPTSVYFISDPGNLPGLMELIDRWLADQKRREGSRFNEIQNEYLSTGQVRVTPAWVRLALLVSGGVIALAVLFIMLLRLQTVQLQRRIRSDEAKYSVMFSASGNGVILVSLPNEQNPRIEEMNPSARRLIGLPEGNHSGIRLSDIFEPGLPPDALRREATGEAQKITSGIVNRESSEEIPVDVHISNLELSGEPHALIVIMDLRRQLEEEKRYRTIADHIYGWEFWTDELHNYRYVSPGIQRMTGYAPENFYEDSNFVSSIIHPDDREKWLSHRIRDVHEHEAQHGHLEFRLITADGDLRWIEHNCVALFGPGGRCIGFRGSNHDVTERKNFEARQQRDLDEKTVMMQEIHHRVKNNLQTISSLINIQAGQIADRRAAGYLQDMSMRIYAMGELHKRLYQGGDLSNVNLKEYCLDLVNQLRSSYAGDSVDVDVEIVSADIFSNMDTAIPFGLILNEAVTNAFKYAFSSGTGEIIIKIDRNEDDYQLVVQDTGPGFPPDVLDGSRRGLGFQIMELLTTQLGGEIRFENHMGAAVNVNFARVVKEEKRWNRSG